MIITLKIDPNKSGGLFNDLLTNTDIEIIHIKSNSESTIIIGSCDNTNRVRNEIDSLIKTRGELPFMEILDDMLIQPIVRLDDFEDILHYSGWNNSWFVYFLSLTRRKSKFCYHDLILLLISRFYKFNPRYVFIKTLFYRKCFMVLKDFRNIRRCYNF